MLVPTAWMCTTTTALLAHTPTPIAQICVSHTLQVLHAQCMGCCMGADPETLLGEAGAGSHLVSSVSCTYHCLFGHDEKIWGGGHYAFTTDSKAWKKRS